MKTILALALSLTFTDAFAELPMCELVSANGGMQLLMGGQVISDSRVLNNVDHPVHVLRRNIAQHVCRFRPIECWKVDGTLLGLYMETRIEAILANGDTIKLPLSEEHAPIAYPFSSNVVKDRNRTFQQYIANGLCYNAGEGTESFIENSARSERKDIHFSPNNRPITNGAVRH